MQALVIIQNNQRTNQITKIILKVCKKIYKCSQRFLAIESLLSHLHNCGCRIAIHWIAFGHGSSNCFQSIINVCGLQFKKLGSFV